MQVKVLFLGPTRDAIGAESERLELGEGSSLTDLSGLIARRHPSVGRSLDRVRYAINEEFAGKDQLLRDGDVVALIPPVSGG